MTLCDIFYLWRVSGDIVENIDENKEESYKQRHPACNHFYKYYYENDDDYYDFYENHYKNDDDYYSDDYDDASNDYDHVDLVQCLVG